ncbi:RNA polymerase sigma factor [Pseudobacter ginsenosidimutans]|uniref:RNA polymerase sigma-70 factor (ECF subfamily) n=1 Tax=Pseudobacter ginsenosidimutans TaxID=661488 RepID=A0A4Q7MT77_9BACT|nr:sigma-70 family RNA polymerase sigma factor [Pseudobacter ginsenosidimutans]RZS71144.1 RNA polymerase sigma-70 factor (ECF subfamily) [Pseudobacter ginsenosidimutans]
MKEAYTYSEQELVDALKMRIGKAFGYLYDHYSAALNGVIMDILQDEEAAGDVLQEVFIKIWKQIEQYDATKGRLFTWMFNIARNAAIDATRRKEWQTKKQRYSVNEYTFLPDKSPHPSEDAGLRRLIQSLKAEYKVLIELSYFQGYTQEEIAEILKLPLGTVKTRMRTAILLLKKQIR